MMTGKKIVLTGILALGLLSGAVHAKDGAFHFFRNGKLESVLVVKKDAPRSVSRAVKEFTSLVRRATGKTMVTGVKPVPGKNNIILKWEERRPHEMDRFSIRFPKKNILQITGSEESIAYALEHILENAFNVRRLVINYADYRWRKRPKRIDRALEVSCEKVKKASIARKTVEQTASFNFKRQLWTHTANWKARNSFPGIHDMNRWAFPPAKYAPNNSWPKEIIPVHNGKKFKMPIYRERRSWGRFKIGWQPCWSHPATLRIAVANILEQLKIAEKQGKKIYSINLDVNDNGGCCRCSKCLEIMANDAKRGIKVHYSNLYWNWVNNIARQVTKKYPDLYINCLAYREVISPPSFKLHPNVIPQICRELTATLRPDVKKLVEGLFENWSKKANVIFLWDYQYGTTNYVFPRIYFHKQAELFRMVHRNNVRGVFIECNDMIGNEGPKHYLNSKLIWNINTDVDKTVREWCEAAVGKKAAPYLLEYFKFWENYWLRPEVRKTNWFTSARATYLQLGEQGTYTYALRKGEMAKLRRLLEKAYANAQTPDQKKRMDIYLNDCFAAVEASAKCLYSELLRPDGTLASSKDAVLLLKSVPEAAKALHFLKTRSIQTPRMQGIVEGGFVSNINTVLPFLKDPAVQAEIRKLAKNKTLPKALQAQLQIMMGKQYKNLFPEGSFESGKNIQKGMTLDTKMASHGKKSVCFRNSGHMFFVNGIKPGKTYYLALDVHCPRNSLEGKFNFMVAPRVKNRNVDWKKLNNLKLSKGWQTIAFAYQTSTRSKVDNFRLVIQAHNFELDEMLHVDNIRVYELD